MVFEVNIGENHEKMLPKTLFFSLHFKIKFGRVWEGFWEGFGRGLEGLGLSWATFLCFFLVLVFGMLSNRGPGGSWAGFWFHFQGFGRGLGRILGRFWERFGGFLAPLGPLLASFFGACILNALQKGSWRLLGWILAPFSRVWEGSGEDFRGVLGGFGGSKIAVFLDCVF